MYIYFLLLAIIFVLVIKLNKRGQQTSSELNSLSTESIQSLFNEFLKKQQLQQEQLTQSHLMNIFRVPKLRGIQGEKWLDVLLSEVLPSKHFALQHAFSTGDICDAVIFFHNGKKLPIDSKFSMENFLKIMNATTEIEIREFERELHKNIKAAINAISKKYVLPAEGTLDFAFMFVASESVYYRTFVENENGLLEYAYKQNVIVTSPNTLYIYLQFVMYGLKGFEIEQNAYKFQQGLAGIIQDLKLFYEQYDLLKDKLDQAQKNYTNGFKLFERAQTTLKNINELSLSDR